MYMAATAQEFHPGIIVGTLVMLAMFAFAIYLLLYATEAWVEGDQLKMKKIFRPLQTFTYEQVGYPKSFQYKRTKYTTVHINKGGGVEEKFLIMNSKALLSFEKKDAEQMLFAMHNLGMERKKAAVRAQTEARKAQQQS